MAEKQLAKAWHRYDMKKLRHCHPMYFYVPHYGQTALSTKPEVDNIALSSEEDRTTTTMYRKFRDVWTCRF